MAAVQAWISLSQFRKHPGMEAGEVLLWVSGAQGSNSPLKASSLSLTVPSLGKLHPTGLSCLQPYSGLSPIPLNVSKWEPLGRTGALDFEWGKLHAYSQLSYTLHVAPGWCFAPETVSAYPNPLAGPQAGVSSLPAWATATTNTLSALSASVLQFSAPPTDPHLPFFGPSLVQ